MEVTLTCMTSPMILVVRMRRDTDGPNKLPGRSRLTLLRSNSGMSSVAWRERRRLELAVDERDWRHDDGLPELSARRRHVMPLCVSEPWASATPSLPERPASPLCVCVCVNTFEIQSLKIFTFISRRHDTTRISPLNIFLKKGLILTKECLATSLRPILKELCSFWTMSIGGSQRLFHGLPFFPARAGEPLVNESVLCSCYSSNRFMYSIFCWVFKACYAYLKFVNNTYTFYASILVSTWEIVNFI